MKMKIYDPISDRFPMEERPEWHSKAVQYLRDGADQGLFGLYLYYIIKKSDSIDTVINIGTARGYSAICAAKGFDASGSTGEIHTIDVIPSDEARDWHSKKHASNDPASHQQFSSQELVSRFHNQNNSTTSIEFHTGDSNTVMRSLNIDPDLVFHDGLHTYQQVSTDIEMANKISEYNPIHVFDDCHLFDVKWSWRPFPAPRWAWLDSVPKFGSLVNQLRNFGVSRTKYQGVTAAVREEIDRSSTYNVEIVKDQNHAPITALIPRNRL